jgi:hypothetical protein
MEEGWWQIIIYFLSERDGTHHLGTYNEIISARMRAGFVSDRLVYVSVPPAHLPTYLIYPFACPCIYI